MAAFCRNCMNGFLGDCQAPRYAADVECVNGIAIDIDVFAEGWQRT